MGDETLLITAQYMSQYFAIASIVVACTLLLATYSYFLGSIAFRLALNPSRSQTPLLPRGSNSVRLQNTFGIETKEEPLGY